MGTRTTKGFDLRGHLTPTLVMMFRSATAADAPDTDHQRDLASQLRAELERRNHNMDAIKPLAARNQRLQVAGPRAGKVALDRRVAIATALLDNAGALTYANAMRLGARSAVSARKLRAAARRGVSVARYQRECALEQARVYFTIARRLSVGESFMLHAGAAR